MLFVLILIVRIFGFKRRVYLRIFMKSFRYSSIPTNSLEGGGRFRSVQSIFCGFLDLDLRRCVIVKIIVNTYLNVIINRSSCDINGLLVGIVAINPSPLSSPSISCRSVRASNTLRSNLAADRPPLKRKLSGK